MENDKKISLGVSYVDDNEKEIVQLKDDILDGKNTDGNHHEINTQNSCKINEKEF